MTRLFTTLLLFFGLVAGAAASTADEPLPVDVAFALEVARSDERIEVRWGIAEGYYLYRDHFRVIAAGTDVSFNVSDGVRKADPGFGDVEVLYGQAVLTLPAGDGSIEITYQGCQEEGICYRPEVRHVDLATLAIVNPDPFASLASGQSPEGADLAGSGLVLAQDSDPAGTVLSGGNPMWIAMSFLGFGLLLAFTPCVFPMYPIVLGMLGQDGTAGGAGKGFILSSTYVVALATAFGLVGAVVGWTGHNIQFAFQSPITTVAMAVLFVALAFASFGSFELQLPQYLTQRVAAMGSGRGSRVAKAATLGFTSSLIVGPCVTAPLAGALLYIGQGGDWRIGALALFMLGMGKGLPLVVLATAGSGLLPRAGCWMETVRRLVGFAFIGMAIWIVTPLMPAGLELVLYVLLAVALGIDLVRRIRPKPATAVTLALVLAGLAVASVLDGKETGQAQARIVLRSTVATSPLEFREARSAADLIEQMKAAAGAPILVYVTADWCVICRSIERSVLTDTDVVAALQGMHLVKLDVTDFNPAAKSVLAQLRAAGPPTMMFLDGSLREASGTRLVGSVSAEAVLRSVKGMAK
jgi:thiol:disulfide interchange protein DsbD